MRQVEGTFIGVGKLALYYQSWHPEGAVRAVVAIAHGLGSHSGQFNTAVEVLVPLGYAVYALDMRGNGRSPGQRGYINSWSEFRDDLDNFLSLIEQQEPGIPCFLWGHSLGAAIALELVMRKSSKLHGLVLTAPALSQIGVSPLRLAIGRILSRIWPRFSLTTGLDQDAASRDPAVVAAYANDPLRHRKGTARLATEFLATVTWMQTHSANLQVPLLILHGTGDRVALHEGSQEFFQRVIFSDKERIEYPGAYHELHDDINHAEVLADLVDWLERHLETTQLPSRSYPSSAAAAV